MLIIRKQQMQALRAGLVDAYVAAAMQRIERKYPAACDRLGRAGTEKLVREGVAKAANFGIEDDPQVDRFVDLLFRTTPAFPVLPDREWVLDILEDHAIDEKAKMDLLYAELADDPDFMRDPV